MGKKEYADEEIREAVINAVAKALEVEPEEVTPDASLINDLGAESVDFLDIGYRIEQEFDIEMPKRNIVQRASQLYGKENFIKERELTSKGEKLLRLAMPEMDPSAIHEGLKEEDLPTFFTVQTFIAAAKEGIRVKNWVPEKCPKCGRGELNPADKSQMDFPDDEIPYGPVFTCKSCNEIITAPTRDKEILKKVFEEE